MKSFAATTLLAVTTLAVSTGDVTVQDSASKDIMEASATMDLTVEGEEGARVLTSIQTATIKMQGDYVNEDKSGIPYIWQCIE